MKINFPIHIIIFLIFNLSFNSCEAQKIDKSQSLIQTSWDQYNLKGMVKMLVTTFDRDYSDTLPKITIAKYEYHNNLEYLEGAATGKFLFNKYGFLDKKYRRYNDSLFLTKLLGSNRDKDIVIFELDSLDYFTKNKILGRKYLPPIFNPNEVCVNRKYIMEKDLKKPDPEYLFETFKYEIDKNKILEESYFLSTNLISEMDESQAKQHLHKRTVNEYNLERQITTQRVFFDENIFRSIPIFHIKTDISNKAKVIYKYKYDTEQRITEVELLVNESKIWQENYFYKNNEKRPYKLDRYIQSEGTSGWFLTDNATEWYNEFGDITKAVDIDDSANAIRTRFYDYRYDKHNNWIECSMYLEGSAEKTEKPTIVAHRTITYYSKSEQIEKEN
ncbi:hypothetical protein [Aequorivita sp. CIP111184]|uniref:hypothetical protein n=1 Tax=Aequorivita sp. CIP111184 TaxID=2211356 RepID=UPI000DBC08BF|nr:hypothetical protein [Aequorivita sp. CIP111184]SRX55246.1 hypothetical protein AEQU1_02268 [Aequorivita sp. CIP111184]